MSAPYGHAPAELPDLRLWLCEQWRPGGTFYREAAPVLDLHGSFPRMVTPDPNMYAHWEHATLRTASLWWVGEDMVDLLIAAARGIPDDVKWPEIQKPSPTGLVVFAKPWLGRDSAVAAEIDINAIVWGGSILSPEVGTTGQPVACLSVSAYRRIVFEDGLSKTEVAMVAQRGGLAHGHREEFTADEQELERLVAQKGHGTFLCDWPDPTEPNNEIMTRTLAPGQTATRIRGCSWIPLGKSDWPVDDPIAAAPWEMDEDMRLSFVEDRKVLVALWTLLHQEGIASTVDHGAPRQTVRRSERAGVPRELSRIRVVTLRKLNRPPRDDEDGHEERPHRDYDHRWMVEGHWRWQPHGKGRTLRRLQFIAPYIKGPDDKPLRTKQRVNAWVR